MRLCTWNVNSLKARLPRVLEFLDEVAPDVLCLQETKSTPQAFPRDVLVEAGYVAVDHSGGRWAGVAILVREDLALEQGAVGLLGESAPEEARWIEATVAGTVVASVYVPNGREIGTPPFAQKLQFLEAIEARVEQLMAAKTPFALLGDFNVCPADSDVYDPSAFVGATHVSAQERAGLEAILAAGAVDVYRALHPDEPMFTWWDYRQGHFHRGLGLRIDLALLSPGLAQMATEVGIFRDYRKGEKPSDHVPMVVDLTL
ncbi:MAG: exodeoxyribonuclease III [Solirubrobacterales bacterium]|nr:exodeoxyribonuclease III [Solirubrobacterales bacterium]